MKDQIYNDMVKYIELSDSIIEDLNKKPSFSAQALQKAASALAGASIIRRGEEAELVSIFRDKPDKALESLAKIAAEMARGTVKHSLGAPDHTTRTSSRFSRESDKVLHEKLGLA